MICGWRGTNVIKLLWLFSFISLSLKGRTRKATLFFYKEGERKKEKFNTNHLLFVVVEKKKVNLLYCNWHCWGKGNKRKKKIKKKKSYLPLIFLIWITRGLVCFSQVLNTFLRNDRQVCNLIQVFIVIVFLTYFSCMHEDPQWWLFYAIKKKCW